MLFKFFDKKSAINTSGGAINIKFMPKQQFASLVGILIGIASFTIGLKICLTTPGVKK